MKCTGRIIVNMVVCLSFCSASDQDKPDSHREIFFQLCDTGMEKIIAEGLPPHSSIALKTGQDTFTVTFRPQFIHGLVSRNVQVFENSSAADTVLEINVRGSSVVYGEVFTRSFFGTRKTQRTVSLNFGAFLISRSDGKVMWSRQFSESVIDTVNYSEADRLNESAPPLTSYKKAELSFFDSILEPAIVTIASGVAIYLFFTIRS